MVNNDEYIMFSPFPSVRLSATALLNIMLCWKRRNRFWCQLAQLSTGQWHETAVNFGVKRSKVKVTRGRRWTWRSDGIASFSTFFGRVAFLVPPAQRWRCEVGISCNSCCLWVWVSVCQRATTWTVWDIIVNFLWEQHIVKSSNEFENGCIPMHCCARMMI